MVAPKDVYDTLTAQGASTNQAIGIMANMINESGFDPEVVGDQGTSFGVVQQHGAYGYLVTGNPSADLSAQVSLLKKLGGFSAAFGSTPGEAAGNFSANYEKCVGCQPGGTQWQGRVANAAKVENWFKTGNWPTAAGSPDTGQQPALTGIRIPGTNINIPTSASDVAGGFFAALLNILGIGSMKDLLERLGLIILGFALVLLGIKILAGGSGRSAQPINISTESKRGPEGSTTTRKVNTPVSKHVTTTTSGATSGAVKTGAVRAAEVAAIA